MTISRLRILLGALLLHLVILACAVPIQTASPSAPAADTVLLATIVAETFSAALQQTAEAASPASTLTPPPVIEETSTPGPPAVGSTLTKQENGTTLFIDNLSGFEVTVPAGWLAVRVNEQEFLDAWNLAETSDPAIQRSLSTIQNQDPEQYRLFALDTQDGHIQSGFVTNMNFLWDKQTEMSFEDSTDLDTVAASLPDTIPGLEILSIETSTNTNGVPFGALTSKWPGKTNDGLDVIIHQKQVFLGVKTGTMVITLSTTEGLNDTVLPAFDAMIETIELLEQ
jgi:hypothetical protein